MGMSLAPTVVLPHAGPVEDVADPPGDLAAGATPVPVVEQSTPPRLLRVLAVAALTVPQALVLLVQGAAPLLLREAPLLLVALHPFAPWSLLVAARTDPAAFLAVVVAVRFVPSCGGYLVGRWYGARALDRLSRKPRAARATAVFSRLSVRFGGPLLVLYPGATSSVLAGINAMPVRRFLPLTLTGLLLAASVTRLLAAAASGPVAEVSALLDRYAISAGVVLVVGVVVVQSVSRWRRSR